MDSYSFPSDDQMLFGPIDLDDGAPTYPIDMTMASPPMTMASSMPWEDQQPKSFANFDSPLIDDNALFNSWINDPSPPLPVASSSFSSSASDSSLSSSPFYFGLENHSPRYAQDQGISPTEFSMPEWASGLFDTSNEPTIRTRTLSHSRPSILSPFHSNSPFQSSSAPVSGNMITRAASSMASRRAESVSFHEDGNKDATVRRRRKLSNPLSDDAEAAPAPLKSTLKPPKLAPSAWQLYFTDWIQRQQQTSTRKLNVAQAAKEAGQEYASLSTEEKEPYKRRSQAMKIAREREHAAYMRTLTPDDIRRENVFRTAQRKAGRSRKSNIKDPNAPKKPLSAYFMFLQKIRGDPELVKEVFEGETETTRQSVLAAKKWRSMSEDERRPFLVKAEREKMEYERERRIYEGLGEGVEGVIGFTIEGVSPRTKSESESESEEELKRRM